MFFQSSRPCANSLFAQIPQLLIIKVCSQPSQDRSLTVREWSGVCFQVVWIYDLISSTQYRSAIFTYSPEQKQIARKVLDEVQEKHFKGTKIVVWDSLTLLCLMFSDWDYRCNRFLWSRGLPSSNRPLTALANCEAISRKQSWRLCKYCQTFLRWHLIAMSCTLSSLVRTDVWSVVGLV